MISIHLYPGPPVLWLIVEHPDIRVAYGLRYVDDGVQLFMLSVGQTGRQYTGC